MGEAKPPTQSPRLLSGAAETLVRGRKEKEGRMKGVGSTKLMELLRGSCFPANEGPAAGGGSGQESTTAPVTQGTTANEVTRDPEFLGHIWRGSVAMLS